jgi:signal transduction histidine kinase
LKLVNAIEDSKNQIEKIGNHNDIKLLYSNNNSGHDIFVEADKGRLTQVISNLLSNAIKFAIVGTTILVTAKEKEQGKDHRHIVFVSVKDTGKVCYKIR